MGWLGWIIICSSSGNNRADRARRAGRAERESVSIICLEKVPR